MNRPCLSPYFILFFSVENISFVGWTVPLASPDRSFNTSRFSFPPFGPLLATPHISLLLFLIPAAARVLHSPCLLFLLFFFFTSSFPFVSPCLSAQHYLMRLFPHSGNKCNWNVPSEKCVTAAQNTVSEKKRVRCANKTNTAPQKRYVKINNV